MWWSFLLSVENKKNCSRQICFRPTGENSTFFIISYLLFFICTIILLIFSPHVIRFDAAMTPRNPIMPYCGTASQIAAMRNAESNSE